MSGSTAMRRRESEPGHHARRIALERHIGVFAEIGEGEHLVHAIARLAAAIAHQRGVEPSVLAPGEIGMKADAQADQRRDRAFDADAPLGRQRHAGEQAHQRGLAGAVAADHADRLAGADRQRQVAQRVAMARRPAGALDARVAATGKRRPSRRRSSIGSPNWYRFETSVKVIAGMTLRADPPAATPAT